MKGTKIGQHSYVHILLWGTMYLEHRTNSWFTRRIIRMNLHDNLNLFGFHPRRCCHLLALLHSHLTRISSSDDGIFAYLWTLPCSGEQLLCHKRHVNLTIPKNLFFLVWTSPLQTSLDYGMHSLRSSCQQTEHQIMAWLSSTITRENNRPLHQPSHANVEHLFGRNKFLQPTVAKLSVVGHSKRLWFSKIYSYQHLSLQTLILQNLLVSTFSLQTLNICQLKSVLSAMIFSKSDLQVLEKKAEQNEWVCPTATGLMRTKN